MISDAIVFTILYKNHLRKKDDPTVVSIICFAISYRFKIGHTQFMTTKPLAMTITPRERDLGGFSVRRILPAIGRKMVGPFIFFDHLGPVTFAPGQGMDVRPHPHIGLATVTFLFDGAIGHRDNLGSVQVIRPGDVNWMTAGSGIAHSERTPPDVRTTGGAIEGIQCWVALPLQHEQTPPTFAHHPSATLPEFSIDGVRLKLLAGSAFGRQSPVHTFSDMIYIDVQCAAGQTLTIPAGERELGAYVVHGHVKVSGHVLSEKSLAIGHPGDDLKIEAGSAARVMIIGGEPFGETREIWWNFVASSKELIEQAKKDWTDQKFRRVPGDEDEFIPLPKD